MQTNNLPSIASPFDHPSKNHPNNAGNAHSLPEVYNNKKKMDFIYNQITQLSKEMKIQRKISLSRYEKIIDKQLLKNKELNASQIANPNVPQTDEQELQ